MVELLKKKSSRKDKQSPVKKDAGRGADKSATTHYFETSRLVEGGLFFIFSALVVVICFLGQKPKGPQLLLKQPAPSRVVAEFSFEYTSNELLAQQQGAVRAQVPPVFIRTFEPYDAFRKVISDLISNLAKTQIEFENEGDEVVQAEFEKVANQLIEASGIEIPAQAMIDVATTIRPKERSVLLNDALAVLKLLYEDGIYANRGSGDGMSELTVIQLIDDEGQNNLPQAQSFEDALVTLRVKINALSRDKETARKLFDIFRAGLQVNLVYSEVGTQKAKQRAIDAIETKPLRFTEGDTLIEPGKIITELDLERVNAYQKAANELGTESILIEPLFVERMMLTAILLLAVYIYVKQGMGNIYKRNRAIAIVAVSILLNLLIIRLIMEIGEIAALSDRPMVRMLPFIAPYALAPILVAVLVGAAPAILCALIVSVLFGIIQNNSIDFMLIAFLSGVVGSYFSSNIRKRSKLVRAGLSAGATAAIAGAIIGALNNYSFGLIWQQALIALIIGLLTSVIAIGILPVLEHIFKVTTEITLLELTDFNHPLLRQMQMEAPGTYHHSLMVANLSENAAAAIGASPLLCRVCSFFHDIGKLVKPEYFVENQRDGINPHDEKNPSMSALVIKAHVKEGVEMAKKHKLPRVITDVIRQHHGTSLIQYFYYQAQQKEKGSTKSPIPEKGGRNQEQSKVDESTYRYDGPKPAFKESAIIFFADGLEAASRSLKKVSQPAIEELIDNIFKDRIEDGQLDECPLTFQELDKIKQSFVYTLLNMLHSRIEYPKDEKEEPQDEPEPSNEPDTAGNQQPV
ncbi:MAG: HD family phosphohydrolase [Coraliomargarita sp.]